MATLSNKKILLGVSGGIAAYKSAILARRLIDEGATVRVVMTQGALAFMQPLTFQALSGNPVHTDLLDPAAEAAMGHIELARWADCILIAPASANTLARLANGMADDLLSTLCLASDRPLYVAPAMNRLMWNNPATVDNCARLQSRGVSFLGPDSGLQACGETGEGRMLEPEAIRDAIIDTLGEISLNAAAIQAGEGDISSNASLTPGQAPLASAITAKTLHNKHLLITAGPTREPIDPVRYISNHSSGKMGFAIAEAAARLGATVTLVAGPVSLSASSAIKRLDVVSANDMLERVMENVSDADIFISVAAVSDYRLEKVNGQKIKKSSEQMELTLIRNPDILKTVAALDERPFCVGFAAETENVKEHALGKLNKKKLDLIAANHVGQAGNPVFGSDTNALDVYWSAGGHSHIASASKQAVAASLLAVIAERINTPIETASTPHE